MVFGTLSCVAQNLLTPRAFTAKKCANQTNSIAHNPNRGTGKSRAKCRFQPAAIVTDSRR